MSYYDTMAYLILIPLFALAVVYLVASEIWDRRHRPQRPDEDYRRHSYKGQGYRR